MNAPRPTLICLSILASVLAATLHAGTPQARRPFALASHSPAEWVYRYIPTPFLSRTINVEGVPHQLFPEEFTVGDDSAGAPMLPVEVLTLGIPAGSTVDVGLRDAEYTEGAAQPVAPRPSFHFTEEREAVAEYKRSPLFYGRNSYFPERVVSVEGPYLLRQANVVTIRLAPLQYNPTTGTLRRLVAGALHIRVTPHGSPANTIETLTPDPRFESVYRSIIANYDEARSWRYRPVSTKNDSTGLWFSPGEQYLRLGVARDGWYRLTHADLAAAGLGSESFDSSRVNLQFRGRPVPLLFAGQDECFFYGKRKTGDSTYDDFYTDTSAYWMSWNAAGSGASFKPVNATSLPEDRTFSVSRVTVHFEQNTDYYEGTGEFEITNNGPVPGEGWVWEYYYPNSTFTHSFPLEHVQTGNDTLAVLRVSLYSTTLHYNTPDHIARFWINDSLAGELAFTGRQPGLFEKPIPSRWLKSGTNTLRITSIATPSVPNQFYLDWFEVDYAREHVASENQLKVSIPALSGSTVAKITAQGFTSGAIRVIDLTFGRTIQGAEVALDSTGVYTVSFRDTLRSGREYVIVADTGALTVPVAAAGTFRGLRQLAGGADYVILTHNRFRAAADQLAAHRAAHNGVRVAVVDVQSIYDEFNYGHISSEPIKAFLRYAYSNWTAPALSNVLLFGDASWDFHRYMTSTVMTNYVPAYGVPAGDNWYVCFDSVHSWLPTLSIGRLPVQDPVQATRTVEKIIGYDNYQLSDWNKNFLFISGGTSAAEKVSFNAQSDWMIQQYVLPASIGGTPFRVYKTTPNTIDGENIDLLRSLVKNGLVFMNFLGHSGGRIWGVDIGSPYDLQNTTGMLPFVTSVSCNVGAFAEPSSNVLSEDFVLADNRAAIGMWSSSSLGYANVGTTLVDLFLTDVQIDTAREFGATTTASRIQLWQMRGSDYITVATVNLTPLLGDPLSRLAIPTKPDLALSPADLGLTIPGPTPSDTSTQISLVMHNYGLVPGDSVAVDLTDYYHGGTSDVLRSKRFRPTLHMDTVLVAWKGTALPGAHKLTAVLDPESHVDEVRKDNNTATSNVYVYVNRLLRVRPFMDQLLSPGVQTLLVAPPSAGDSPATAYVFEVDTASGFDSPAKVASGPVTPGPVGARWITPSFGAGTRFFWRARAIDDTLAGQWLGGACSVADNAPVAPMARWLENASSRFPGGTLSGTQVTDSGVTLLPTPSLLFGARSVGYRGNSGHDFYSTIRINKEVITGLWWEHGNSFMSVRLNEFTGAFDFKPFNIQADASLSDSMNSFIDSTPAGNYLAFTVIYDGYTNVSEKLRSSLRALGSSRIDSVRPGHAWILIARKGAGGQGTVEQWSPNGVAEDSIMVPNTYAIGSGTLAASGLPFPQEYKTFSWVTAGDSSKTTLRAFIVGTNPLGKQDTLAALSRTPANVDLTPVNGMVRDSIYSSLAVAAALTTADATVTPRLTSWSLDFVPPPDLAISSHTIGVPKEDLQKISGIRVPVTVHNIGFCTADSAHITVSSVGIDEKRVLIAEGGTGRIPVDSLRTAVLTLPSESLNGLTTLEITVAPPRGTRDLLTENNTVRIKFDSTFVQEPLRATMQLYADGVQLMDGDYVGSKPNLTVRFTDVSDVSSGGEHVALFVDRTIIPPSSAVSAAGGNTVARVLDDGVQYLPELKDGLHELVMRLYRWNGAAGTDSIERRLTVNVQSDVRLFRLFNYPNPFRRVTEFTFVLTGNHAADEVRIRIFTIAGRKIRELVVPHYSLQVGFNRVMWDGLDEEGDEIANGYYLYQVEVRGDGVQRSAIEKLVKVR